MIKKIFFYVLFIALIPFLTNCAGTSKASAEQSEAAKSFNKSEDKGTVYVYRTGRMVGAATQSQIKVNGHDAGGTGPSTFLKWDLKPGIYTIAASTNESSKVVQLDVKAGEQYFLRLDDRMGLTSGGRVTLKEVSKEKGKAEVKKCKLLVSSYIPE
jgi:Protein of unknown function (DUF2846)